MRLGRGMRLYFGVNEWPWCLLPLWWTGPGMLRIEWLAFSVTWYGAPKS